MDAATKAATALQKAQATGIYAGLGLWPKDVIAGLVAGQLAEDGIYPDAGAAFEAGAQTNDLQQPVGDYSPDQPRDPQGRWSEGGGEPSTGQSEGAGGEADTSEPLRSLTIRPKASRSSNEEEEPSPQSRTTNGFLGEIGSALSHLNPISTAHAGELGELSKSLPKSSATNPPQVRVGSQERYYYGSPEFGGVAPDGTPITRIQQTCADFIAENCRAKILRVFPGQYLDQPLDNVFADAAKGVKAAQTAKKLLIENRFRK